MKRNVFEEEPVAYEPIPVLDTFVTGILPAEDVGPLIRLTFYSDRPDGSGGIERMIVYRVVLLRSALAALQAAAVPAIETVWDHADVVH